MKKLILSLIILSISVTTYCQSSSLISVPIHDMKEADMYFRKRLQYPIEAMDSGVIGTVLVKFTVHSDGVVGNIIPILSPSKILTDAVVEVIERSSGYWIDMTKDSINFILPVVYNKDIFRGPTVSPMVYQVSIESAVNLKSTVILKPIQHRVW